MLEFVIPKKIRKIAYFLDRKFTVHTWQHDDELLTRCFVIHSDTHA